MDLAKAGERKIIETIRKIVRKKPAIVADFDDDAAIVELDSGRYAVTTDMGIADTHFLTEDPMKIGKKIVTSNATDLLAKGAVPEYMLISLGLPADQKLEFVKMMYESMDRELLKYGARIIGGDTNKSKSFVCSVTMIGRVLKPLLRRGAREGDLVILTGQVGNAAAGYMALRKGLVAGKDFIRAQLEPEIDHELCKRIIPAANAGIDISDGLAYELGEISRLSGKRITIRWERLPIHPGLEDFCAKNKLDLMEMVLHSGEDYQIVYTTSDPANGIIIGEVEKGTGLYLSKDGEEQELEPRGYEHFR